MMASSRKALGWSVEPLYKAFAFDAENVAFENLSFKQGASVLTFCSPVALTPSNTPETVVNRESWCQPTCPVMSGLVFNDR